VPPAEKPWTAPARVLVLYNAEDEWRYAIYSDVGVVDGVLDGLPGSAAAEEAQTALLTRVADVTGRRYSATWDAQAPHRWTADLSVVDP
jgi:hypothetical protein